ncbi:MAG: hypothetical protein V7752_07065 [Halopseudomonas sp.]
MEIARQSTAVLIAEDVNVNTFQQLWLLENGILTSKELKSGAESESVYTPVAVNVRSDDFELLVVPERIQVLAKNAAPQEFFERVFVKTVEALPALKSTAFGFNFTFVIKGGDDLAAKVKSIFIPQENPLAAAFTDDNARSGIYLSKDIFGARLRLDVKPIKPAGKDGLRLAFNTHWDISTIDGLKQSLALYDQAEQETQMIADLLITALEGKE